MVEMYKEKFLRIFYNALCFVGAGFWMMRYLLAYVANEDISSISFESFDRTSNNGYPTFTICFTDRNKTVDVLNPDVLNAKYHPSKIAIDFYSQDVNGDELDTWTTSEFLKYAGPSIKIRNKNISSTIGKTEFPFFLSYQDYQKACFTKKKAPSPSTNMRYDQVTLNMNKFEVDNEDGIPMGAEKCARNVKMDQNSNQLERNRPPEGTFGNKPGSESIDKGTQGNHIAVGNSKHSSGNSLDRSYDSIENNENIATSETLGNIRRTKASDESDMILGRKDKQQDYDRPNPQRDDSEKMVGVSSLNQNENRLKNKFYDKYSDGDVKNRPIMRQPINNSKPGGKGRVKRSFSDTRHLDKEYSNEMKRWHDNDLQDEVNLSEITRSINRSKNHNMNRNQYINEIKTIDSDKKNIGSKQFNLRLNQNGREQK